MAPAADPDLTPLESEEGSACLLGKPIAESDALVIPTAVHPFPGGPGMAWQTTYDEPPVAGAC